MKNISPGAYFWNFTVCQMTKPDTAVIATYDFMNLENINIENNFLILMLYIFSSFKLSWVKVFDSVIIGSKLKP